jgi:hypothetical protein
LASEEQRTTRRRIVKIEARGTWHQPSKRPFEKTGRRRIDVNAHYSRTAKMVFQLCVVIGTGSGGALRLHVAITGFWS